MDMVLSSFIEWKEGKEGYPFSSASSRVVRRFVKICDRIITQRIFEWENNCTNMTWLVSYFHLSLTGTLHCEIATHATVVACVSRINPYVV